MKLVALPVFNLTDFIESVNALDFDDLIEICHEAKEIIDGEVLKVFEEGNYIIHGGIYGDLVTLFDIWSKIRDVNSYRLVFLGNVVGKGPKQLEVLLLVLSLKARKREEVQLILGVEEYDGADFPEHLIARFGARGKELYGCFKELFSRLPLAVLVRGKALAVNSSPPLTNVKRGCKPLECYSWKDPRELRALMDEILWSKPSNVCSWDDDPSECVIPSPTLKGFLWGSGMTKRILKTFRVDKIIRDNDVVEGIKVEHRGKVITLLTSRTPTLGNKRAAALVIKMEEKRARVISL